MSAIIKKHSVGTILPLAAVAMFASASVSNAASVVYKLTATAPAGFGGSITFDTDFAPFSSSGGVDTYNSVGAAFAIQAFSINAGGVTFTESNTARTKFELKMSTANDTPLSLGIDMDFGSSFFFTCATDNAGTYVPINFGTGSGAFNLDGISPLPVITGAALTPVPESSAMALLGLGGLALFIRRRR